RGAAEGDQQFPPSDGDCHAPSRARVRKCNDTTPRAGCPNCVAPARAGRAALLFRRALINRDCPADSAASSKKAAASLFLVMLEWCRDLCGQKSAATRFFPHHGPLRTITKIAAWRLPAVTGPHGAGLKIQWPPAPGMVPNLVHARIRCCIIHSPCIHA